MPQELIRLYSSHQSGSSITMQLRKSIRPPQRYDSDNFYQLTQRPLREIHTPERIPYIDYNPDLPPAAFPTLDRPRPAGETSQKKPTAGRTRQDGTDEKYTTRSRVQNQNAPPQNQHSANDQKAMAVVDYEDMSIDELDNRMASNGEFNPVYMKNMSVMASLDPNSVFTDRDLDDSTPEDTKQREVSTNSRPARTSHSEWGYLAPRLQVEIFSNILQKHEWSRACHLLGLTREERVEIQEHITRRNMQIEMENAQLKEMREKQHRALLRIDNTTLRSSRVPHQLVFRKISRQYTRKLRERIQYDYFLCNAGELLDARQFLLKRELDRRYAGEWSNSEVILQTPVAHLKLETWPWDWGERMEFELESPAVIKPSLPNEHGFSTNSNRESDSHNSADAIKLSRARENSIKEANRTGTINPADLQISKGDMIISPRWSEPRPSANKSGELNVEPDSQESGLVHFRIGSGRAAKVRHYEELSTNHEPELPRLPLRYDPMLASSSQHLAGYDNSIVDHETTDLGFHQRPCSTDPFSQFSQPLERALGGCWSNGFSGSNLNSRLASSTSFMQRLEVAQSQAQGEREKHGNSEVLSGSRTVSNAEPPRTVTIPGSKPCLAGDSNEAVIEGKLPPPPSHSGTSGGIAGNLDESWTMVPTSDGPSEFQTHESEYYSEDTPISTPDSSSSACDEIQPTGTVQNRIQTSDSEYVDNEEPEDEMVLLPT
ncbi:hypothetical protein MAP00_004982 [Monascus purpureus]|nr:hypothetical protein MAP00_004982 [Monascus purpureus]